MNRADLQRLTELRVADAEVLLQARHWPAAYYLLGYAIECALKACAARQFSEHVVPDKRVVNEFYTHELEKLLNISGAKEAWKSRAKRERGFQVNWSTVRDWSEAARYDLTITEATARDMYTAVTDATSGVLPWLKTVW